MEGLWFDGRYIDPIHPDGISRFSIGLIAAALEITPLTVLVSSEQQAQQLPKHKNLTVHHTNAVTSPTELLQGFRLSKQGVKVLFSPMQTTGGLGRNFKLIYTLHDLIYYRHRTPPAGFSILIRIFWFIFHLSYWPQRRILNMADAVVTVSETTKDQMEKHRLTKRPIYVIHNAADSPGDLEKKVRHDSTEIIYMGSFIGYKNVETLIRGMRYLPDHTLVLLSRISDLRKRKLQNLADKFSARIRFENGVTDEQYYQWLYRAKALVSASLDEGFGIPVVEAMARGCPVVLSDIQIFEEVAGPAGLRFAPFSEIGFAEQIKRLNDKNTWKLQSALGLDQAQFFTWQDSAELLIELAEELTT